MKKFIFLALSSLLCVSCFQVNMNYKTGGKNAIKGEGPVMTKSLDFKDFDALCVTGNADVVFTQADDWEVTLSTQENIFDELDYKVVNGVLLIQAKNNRIIMADSYDLTIRAPGLKRIEVNGATEFEIPAGLRTDGDLEIEVNGAGDLDFTGIACRELNIEANGASDIDVRDIDVQTLNVEINGLGDVSVGGKAGTASFEVSGAGDIDARGLDVAGEVKRRSSGLASIRLK